MSELKTYLVDVRDLTIRRYYIESASEEEAIEQLESGDYPEWLSKILHGEWEIQSVRTLEEEKAFWEGMTSG
jgi:CRISPR/Cas system-associated protein Csm6